MRNPKESRRTNQGSCPDPLRGDAASSAAMQELRGQWDTNLGCLTEPGAADRLRDLMRAPCKLNGEVIAGESS